MSAVKHDFQQFTVETTKYTKKSSSSQHVDAIDQLDYAQKMRDKKNLPLCKIRFPTLVAFHSVWKWPKKCLIFACETWVWLCKEKTHFAWNLFFFFKLRLSVRFSNIVTTF